MMQRRSRTAWTDRGMLWLACAVALAAGFAVAGVQLNAAIDDTHERTADALTRISAGTTLLAAAPQLERASRAADETIGSFDLHADAPTLVARFIRSSAVIAAAHRVRVDQIDQRSAAASVVADPANRVEPSDVQFAAIPLDVGLSGSYRDLLATIAAVAQGPVAVRVTITSFERRTAVTSGDRADALTARLHVDVLHLPDPMLGTPGLTSAAVPVGPSPGVATERNPATNAPMPDPPTLENTSHARPI